VSAAVEAAQTPATVARMRERARAAALALDWDAVVDGFEKFLSGGVTASARARRPRTGFAGCHRGRGVSARHEGAIGEGGAAWF
jgi:hypothetical protein